ncbi:hypothetical protein FA15DRAFT_741947 [Coprinopsis marcescibilis]|uniref:DUF4219 domain-containing protein n=1 Tax=Coprinopsis marcescibilis TaxID=230819 RepID=A0A5C3K9I6_COPMA|nr:hypothetical protein FA15DRAFT_741947 [Coprinopsis marcescibilis]
MFLSLPSFPKLSHTNYNSWAGDMEAWFCSQGLWRLVSGSSPCPVPPKSSTTSRGSQTVPESAETSSTSSVQAPASPYTSQGEYEAALDSWETKAQG